MNRIKKYFELTFKQSFALCGSHMARAGNTFLSQFIPYPLRATSATRGTLGAIFYITMCKQLILIFTFINMISCKTHHDNNRLENFFNTTIAVDSINIPLDSNQYYYPFELFTDSSCLGCDTILVKYFSYFLWSIREPLLFNKSYDKDIYRFLWIRSFDDPIIIKIEKYENIIGLNCKVSNGKEENYPGVLIRDYKKTISQNEWNRFLELIELANFWSLPTIDNIYGNDGSYWILESQSNGYYHIVCRWSPEKGGFYNCCDYLIGLSDFKISDIRKY